MNPHAAWLLCLLPAFAAGAEGRFGPDHVAELENLSDPDFSPDGRHVVYAVSRADTGLDRANYDLWRLSWDGAGRSALTATAEFDEWQPAYSPDGRWIAFLSDRGEGEERPVQVWALPADGGEARQLTNLPGGVEDYAWSPDGRRLALIAWDPEFPEGTEKPKNKPPIVTERYHFKEDGIGYLTSRRRHLYLFDIAESKAVPLTAGQTDEYFPSWSPDGGTIAYVTKRGDDPDRHNNWDIWLVEARAGGAERQLTRYVGADLEPYWESRPEWSPDGRHIAYLQGGLDKDIYYAASQLAIVDVATGESRLPAPIDRFFYRPRWSPDGRSVLALVEQSRVTHLSRVDAASGALTPLTSGLRLDYDFALAPDGRVAVLGGDELRPYGLSAVERRGLRPLEDHNAFLAGLELARSEPIFFKSADGTDLEGILVKPVGYQPGRRYPTILRIHGGPVYQFSHEFMYEWQVFAAAGYAVVGVNPRGSSGRGSEFAYAIYADWGNKDVQDVLAGVDHVVALGVADPERLGVGGWSYGGILTNYVIASDTRFDAAISGAGTSNMLGDYGFSMYVKEYENELGLPWEKTETYLKLSYPLLRSDRIVTPTAFFCAELDVNVPCHGSEQMYQSLKSRGVPSQLVVYPGESHSLTVPSYLRDEMERYLAWYDRYLKPVAWARTQGPSRP